ncbi:MAG: hypothetical protein K1X74_01920 [Pirellulales bacterium]|nr:hypothetical protein [Pirellulales bacterium]
MVVCKVAGMAAAGFTGDCAAASCTAGWGADPATCASLGGNPGSTCSLISEVIVEPSFDSNLTISEMRFRSPPAASQGSQKLYEWPSDERL